MPINTRSNGQGAAVRRRVVQCYFGAASVRVRSSLAFIESRLLASHVETATYANDEGAKFRAGPLGLLPAHGDYILVVHHDQAPSPDDMVVMAALAAPILLVHYTQANGRAGSLQG